MDKDNGYWRVIDTGAGDGGWNMAVDEALLLSAGGPGFRPTLRFYSWERASLSIGSFQKAHELNIERIEGAGVPLVRRPTGGRAVLHDAELTYSITCPVPSPFFPSDLMGSYKSIGNCFLRGLRLLGVEAALVPVSKNPDRKKSPHKGGNPLCFSSPSWYEVLLGGKKLIGSAQRRQKDAFLQQGSLLIKTDIGGLLAMLRFEDEAVRKNAHHELNSKMTGLRDMGVEVDMNTLKSALVQGFEAEMGTRLTPGGLTAEETESAKQLLCCKYGSRAWNLFRRTGEESG